MRLFRHIAVRLTYRPRPCQRDLALRPWSPGRHRPHQASGGEHRPRRALLLLLRVRPGQDLTPREPRPRPTASGIVLDTGSRYDRQWERLFAIASASTWLNATASRLRSAITTERKNDERKRHIVLLLTLDHSTFLIDGSSHSNHLFSHAAAVSITVPSSTAQMLLT